MFRFRSTNGSSAMVCVTGLLLLGACTSPATPFVPDDKGTTDGTTEETTEGSADTGTLGEEVADEAPVAIIGVPETVRVGVSASFDGSDSYDPQGYGIVAYDWACTGGVSGAEASLEVTFEDEGYAACTLTVTSESGLDSSTEEGFAIIDIEVASWTFMVFVNGDNDLEWAALDDMNELEQVGSTEEVNLVVQMDRSTGYASSDGNWSGARRYLVEQDEDGDQVTSAVLEDLGAVDSGDPETVIDFVSWAVEAYPAEHYALVLWNHGWGWSMTSDSSGLLKGISSDDSTGNDISVAEGELEQILEATTDLLGGERLDLLGMDACTMASWEIAHVSAPYADILVASQDYEGEDGWAYDAAMEDLVDDPGMSAEELGDSIALRFHESGDSTQSVIDLNSLEELDAAIDALAQALLESDEPKQLIKKAAKNAQSFDYWDVVDHDLGDFLDLLVEESDVEDVDDAATAARDLVADVVLSNYTRGNGVKYATGLSIYTPTSGSVSSLYLQGTWAENSLWDDVLIEAFGT
ncbi:MAG: clostripain-related cysteine peptidase [Myxococcota bacterium]|jgi:hypothetical protein|nr:clostripain-related cysteine peptidase [Myxococcota bacterium]